MATQALLERTITSTHNPTSGRYDAQRLARLLGISTAAVARIIGRNDSAVRKHPDAPAYQAELARLVRLLTRLNKALGSAKNTRIWLNATSDDLGGKTPMSYLLKGQLAIVETLVDAALTGEGI